MPRRKFDWETLSDEQLLERRLSSLRVTVGGTWLEDCVSSLHEELKERGLRLRPHAWISSEWFSPDSTPGIAIPFYLAHPRLMKLEKKMMLEVEGGTREWFMKLIRHEAAHAFSYAYRLPKKKKWQQIFGQTSREETPQFYRPRPFSRSYVMHLDDWYAQSHPDEDFAETFAVWLTPGSDWARRYQGWKALQKLEYVDELMKQLAGRPPVVSGRGPRRRGARPPGGRRDRRRTSGIGPKAHRAS